VSGWVLDTSSVLAVFYNEPGREEVVRLLESRRTSRDDPDTQIVIPFIALMEVEYRVRRRAPAVRVEESLLLIDGWPAGVMESSPSWRHAAAAIKAGYRLSLADAWVASLALIRDAELVHKDPEFDQIPDLKALRLPYKVR